MNKVTIKRIGEEEVSTLLNFSKEVFFAAFAHLNNAEDMAAYAAKAFSPEQLLKEISNPDSKFYFAYLEGTLTGYLKLNFNLAQTENQGDGAMEVERIYVDPGFQNKQIGQQLLDFALQTAAEIQIEKVWLGVWEHNLKAIKFYERNGFVQFDKHKFMLGNDKQTDLLLQKILK